MLSSASSLLLSDVSRKLPAEIVAEQDRYFKELIELYEGRDDHIWTQKYDETLFKMWATQPPGQTVHMMKMRVTMRAPLQAVIDTTQDYDRRIEWDTNLYDFRVLSSTPCGSYRQIYYAFKSPPTVADRDFYLCEHFRRNFPEPGMCTLFVKSLPANDEQMP